MRQMRLTIVLLLVMTALAAGGDLKYKMIAHYESPNYQPGSGRFSEEDIRQLEIDLQGQGGAQILANAGCTNLAHLYNQLMTDQQLRDLARQIAGMAERDLYVYFVVDVEGLTQSQRDFAGLCDWTEGQGDAQRRFAWLCAHPAEERAIKIGERFAARFVEAFGRLDFISNASTLALRALCATFLGELIHTVAGVDWQPNDLVLKPAGAVSDAAAAAEGPARRGVSSTEELRTLTLLPTHAGARARGISYFLCLQYCPQMRELLFRCVNHRTIVYVLPDSQTQRAIDAVFGQATGVSSPDRRFLGYFWGHINIPEVLDNEVFIGLMLHYFAGSLEPRSSQGQVRSALTEALSFYGRSHGSDPNLAAILGHLLESFPLSDGAAQRQRMLFILTLCDLLGEEMLEVNERSDMIGSHREGLQRIARDLSGSASQATSLMDAYLGGDSSSRLRTRLRVAMERTDSLHEKVAIAARQFGQTLRLPDTQQSQ